MKKILLFAVIVLCSLTASAQTGGASPFFSTEKAGQGVNFGIELGVNMSKLTGDIDNVKSRVGFNAGVAVNIPLVKSLYVKTGLQYTEKGVKGKGESSGSRITAGYIELPVLASYRYDFDGQTQLQVNIGPYFAYGVTGEVKSQGLFNGTLDTFGDNGVLKRFDAGLHLSAGVTVSRNVYAGLGYEFGLNNINDTEDDVSLKNGNFFVSLGYIF